jgi:hypothetical protein
MKSDERRRPFAAFVLHLIFYNRCDKNVSKKQKLNIKVSGGKGVEDATAMLWGSQHARNNDSSM